MRYFLFFCRISAFAFLMNQIAAFIAAGFQPGYAVIQTFNDVGEYWIECIWCACAIIGGVLLVKDGVVEVIRSKHGNVSM